MTIKQIIFRIALIVWIVEVIIMQSLDFLDLNLSSLEEAFIDAFSLAIISTPFIYMLIIKPFIVMKNLAIEEVSYLAYHDKATELPNRNRLLDLLEYSIKMSENDDRLSIIAIEIDRVKTINHKFGHKAVEHVINTLAKRLKDTIDSSWLLSRTGPNKFTLLIENIESDDVIFALSKHIRKQIKKPIHYDGHNISMDACIGISNYPKDTTNKDDLLKYADTAIGQAKINTQDQISFYTQSLTDTVHKNFKMEEDLKDAVNKNQFFLLYQPKIDAQTNKLMGVEALIRWQHPTQGLINPIDFICIAEESGLIIEIGSWVLKEALKQQKRWKEEHREPIIMSINLSSKQLRPDQIVNIIKELNTSDISLDYIEFEITETSIMENLAQAQTLLEVLHNKGVSLAIDDFGTGYSSFGYLKRFQVNVLKIDMMLIKDIEKNSNDFAIAKAIIVMAHTLNMKVVAEGIETENQAKLLRDVGCDYFQGYFYSRPVNEDSVYSNNNYII